MGGVSHSGGGGVSHSGGGGKTVARATITTSQSEMADPHSLFSSQTTFGVLLWTILSYIAMVKNHLIHS